MYHWLRILSVVVVLATAPALAATTSGIPCPQCGKVHAVDSVSRYIVRRDENAYQHAVREAKILASRGTAGHPLGVAPGCRYSGTGYSFGQRPHHCYYGELSESRLIARAVVRGRNGAYYWSAHYR